MHVDIGEVRLKLYQCTAHNQFGRDANANTVSIMFHNN